MSKDKDAELLLWAVSLLRKAQDDGAFCKITIDIKNGEIYRAERTDSYLPPAAGTLVKRTGG